MDFTVFFEDNNIYNHDLAVNSSLFSAIAYSKNGAFYSDNKKEHDYYELRVENKSDNNDTMSITEVMNLLDFDDVKEYDLRDNNYQDEHVAHFYIANKKVEYNNETKNIVVVFVRGTTGVKEWISNFDIGMSNDKRNASERNDFDNHLGFDVAAYRIILEVEDYLTSHNLYDTSDTVFWITGHSRGAAIANIIASEYEKKAFDTFTYTFATPNTTVKSDSEIHSYSSIYNIVNSGDFVPEVPLESEWGFKKYGNTISHGLTKFEKSIWFTHMNGYSYTCADSFLNILDAFKVLAKNRDECYKGNVPGEVCSRWISTKDALTPEEVEKQFLDSFPENCIDFVQVKEINITIARSNWRVDYITAPYVLMYYMGELMGGEKFEDYSTVIKNIISPDKVLVLGKVFEDLYICQLMFGKIPNAHYMDTYYIITQGIY